MDCITWGSIPSGVKLDLAKNHGRITEYSIVLVCPKQREFLGYETFSAKSQANWDRVVILHPGSLLAGPGVGSNCVSFSKGQSSGRAALSCSYILLDLVINLCPCNLRPKGSNCFSSSFSSRLFSIPC